MTDRLKPDPLDVSRQWLGLSERAQKALADFMSRKAENGWQNDMMQPALQAYQQFLAGWSQDPARLLAASTAFWKDYTHLWQQSWQKMMGKEAAPVVTVKDKRFADDTWQQNAVFDFIKQSYALTAGWVQHVIRDTPGIDAKSRNKIEFFTRQWLDAASPSNFWMTNPEALKQVIDTGGESLLRGFKNLLEDIERGDGELKISMTNPTAFRLGENMASTPGQVIYRNEMMELIQYAPTTNMVGATPLLIIPPWINKYYILDLQEQNSFVRHAVENGHTVFMISWINPDASHAQKSFEDYMAQGPLAALDVIDKICGTNTTNIVGYCLGGTLLSATLAYLHHHGRQSRVNSATYLVTMVDFSEPGDLGVFIDDMQITALETHMFQRGYLEASAMATTFNLLRANDLIWSFVVNNYLLGREPMPFDLLYWNADATRMPATMHSYYLRQMYLNNRLCKPNALKMLNTPIDLTQIETPSYILATRDDHIAPWRSAYACTQIYKGPTTFVLAGSGHIAGVINAPAANKYGYWTNSIKPISPDSWLESASEHKGSWWLHWDSWLKQFSGHQVPARQPGSRDYQPLEAAPGSYVKVRAA